MTLRKPLSAIAAASLLIGSTAAVAAPADAPRKASSVVRKDELAGAGTFAVIAALVVATAVLAVVVTGDDDEPESP